MSSYSENIVLIGDDYNKDQFPERFANAIYVSEICSDFYYKYQSSFSIKYNFQGTDHYQTDGKVHNVKAGQVLVVNDGSDVICERSMPKSNRQPSTGMSIFLDNDVISDVFADLDAPDDIREPGHKQKPFPLFYDHIIHDDPLFAKFIHSVFRGYHTRSHEEIPLAMYYEIARHLMHFQFRFFEKVRAINKVKYSTRKEIFSRACVAKEYLENTYAYKFCLDSLARESAMSKYFLIKSFKSIFKKTPQQYHIDLRVRKAQEMLKANSTVSDIATQLGYANIHCFSRQFKAVTGLSPLGFRQAIE